MEIFKVSDDCKVAILRKPSEGKNEVHKYKAGRIMAPLFSGSYIECRRFISRYSAMMDSSDKA